MFKRNGRKICIDMDKIHIPQYSFLQANKAAWKKRQELKRLCPFGEDPFRKRKYETPEKLQKAVDDYFDKCYGVLYYRGSPILDKHGDEVIGQTRPFTISGLARHLGITTNTLRNYEINSRAGLIPPEYAAIIIDAKMKIQEYAEQRLYDRDGSAGARFVLEAGFGWITKTDERQLKQTKKRIKISQDKLKLAQAAADAKILDDKEFIVNILRAGESSDD